MPRLFVSYSRADSNRVDRIISYLRDSGCDVWLDRHDIRSGEQWRQQITTNVRQADAFVLFLSRTSAASDNVRREVDIASDAHTKIIPVKLDAVEIPESLQYQLAGLQFIDHTSGSQATLDELVRTVGGTPGAKTRRSPGVVRAAVFGVAIGGALSLIVESSHSIWNLMTRDLWSHETEAIRNVSIHMPCEATVPIILCAAAGLFALLLRPRWRPWNGGAIGAIAGLALAIALQFPSIHGCLHLENEPQSAAAKEIAGGSTETPPAATRTPAAASDDAPKPGSPWPARILMSVKIMITGLVVGVLVGMIGPLLRVVGWGSRLVE